ncbi:NlpC/P60 family protein [Glycocaulis profundi]|nr:NlpC/P60 family protein [Glycocaulis profundi]
MDPFSWTLRYMPLAYVARGRDWRGVDCWGLAALVWREERGVVLPEPGDYSDTEAARAAQMASAAAVARAHFRRIDRRTPFAIANFIVLRQPVHVGLVVDAEHFLHAAHEEGGVVLARFDDPRWRDRLEGLYVPA